LKPTVERYSEATVPTEYGDVRVVVFRGGDGQEHIAIVVGDVATAGPESDRVLVRVHSECWTGEVLRSHKCDCRDQLDTALQAIRNAGRGVVIYMRQEGRGIGLGNKIRAYALQEKGADTVDANRMLGFGADERTYEVAAAMLRDLGVHGVALLTNNPRKVEGLQQHGIRVVERVPLAIEPNQHNVDYLAVKAKKMGHAL
jgi:GTP cyclohydrolase II/3,4-dihydroxy 2-butanone 4-phosphate synthase/GTP cyclohydrolase II